MRPRTAECNIRLYVGCLSPVTPGPVNMNPAAPRSHSVPRIADQRLAGPEHQHQQNTQHAQHGKNRLVQDNFDDTVPEPGRGALHPGAESLLAGLMDVVPELTKPGETQGLI